MPNVKLYVVYRERREWENKLPHEIIVYDKAMPCDTMIGIGGKFLNPMLAKRKVLITDTNLWGGTWSIFKDVISEYYDKIIDVKNLPIDRIRELITETYKDETKKS